MSLNPVTASREIYDRYCSYITTTFRLNRPDLNEQIEKNLREPGKFAKGPLLQIIPPFLTGASIMELIEQGVLNPDFENLSEEKLPSDRSLYYHQQQAIETISEQGKSAVVATGTGSGKTECFLIPILNHLLNEKKRGTLDPGVRALLLYPMNALANDQIKRLRCLLANEPEITFGIYTGETVFGQTTALEKYGRMYGGTPLPNEIISRERMREGPPHILLTNYAMLEYLMLRPADKVFFQGLFAHRWQFVVLDEAHTYTGAKGIEMAMLLARLKNAVGAKKGDLRFILTSATLGKGQEDAGLVAKFASKLTGEAVTKSQVITAVPSQGIVDSKVWGKPDPSLYQELQGWLEMGPPEKRAMEERLHKGKVPDIQVREFLSSVKNDISHALFELLQGDQRVQEIISLMEGGPADLYSLAPRLFGKGPNALMYAASFIDLCNRVKPRTGDNALLPARFHFFVKALEGAFIAFTPKTHISLERVRWIREDGRDYKAFELGACTRCHGLYLVGEITQNAQTGYSYLEPVANNYNMESYRNLEFFAVTDGQKDLSDNEDDVLEGLGLQLPDFKNYRLCVYCGAIGHAGASIICDCSWPHTIQLTKVNHKGRAVKKCGLCGSTSSRIGVVRRVYLSEDAVSSVLGTALYQNLPGRVLERGQEAQESIFGSALETATGLEDEKVKQLLVFSDSRQNAAFFAPYLSKTYSDLLAGNLLVRTLGEYEQECLHNKWNLVDFNRRVCQYINRMGVLEESVETLEELVWKWIMREFTMQTGRFSLESMGLLTFLPNLEQLKNGHLLWTFRSLQKAGIDIQETKVLYSFFIEEFRKNRAVEYPHLVRPQDEFFAPQNQQGAFWSRKPSGVGTQPGGYSLKGWLPTEGYTNTRLDYLQKILNAGDDAAQGKKSAELLNDLWRTLIDPGSPLQGYINSETLRGRGVIYKLNPSLFRVVPGRNNTVVSFYRCDTCHRITKFNIRDLCPAYKCPGKLRKVDLDTELKDNHYRNLHLNMKPESMITHEHTAQLATEYAARVQTDFIHGKINVLSCSTTFELGVDVGELETVFMKNVPPTPANYAQRAGRAGRRVDATAYALTFARLASHDFNQFGSPQKMIKGVVKPPYFDVDNEKIARRHLYACAFAHFWRAYPTFFRWVHNFFGQNGPDRFREHLSKKPSQLLQSLREIFSSELQERLGIENWSWVDEMYDEQGVMTKVVKEIMGDLLAIDNAIEKAVEEKDFGLANRLQWIQRTIEGRPLINHLAQKSLLPKYGFPVDVVNLDVNMHAAEGKNIDLSRDLQIAIGEYAPDSEVVANGRLWTGRYVKRVKGRDLVRYHYVQCRCGYFSKSLDVEIDHTPELCCPVCEQQAQASTFVVPEFGFIAEGKTKDPGTKRPERTYACRKFFSGEGALLDTLSINLGNDKIFVTAETHGVLTVVNNGLGSGFYLCKVCGYGTSHYKPPEEHKDAYGGECWGGFEKVSLGYNLETDIARIDCSRALRGVEKPKGYWESLLFALIDGMSEELEIDRNDLDGTIFIDRNGLTSLILFDPVPGGAGHVKRILEKGVLKAVVCSSLNLLKRCTCGGERGDTSCYGCLRNYQNQFVHDRLRRDYGIDALERILGKR